MKHKRIKKVENITRWKFSEVLIEAEVEYFFFSDLFAIKTIDVKKFFSNKKKQEFKNYW